MELAAKVSIMPDETRASVCGYQKQACAEGYDLADL